MASLTDARIAGKVKALTKQMADLYERAKVTMPSTYWDSADAKLAEQLAVRPLTAMQIDAICMAAYRQFEKDVMTMRKR